MNWNTDTVTVKEWRKFAKELISVAEVPGTVILQDDKIYWREIGVSHDDARFVGFLSDGMANLQRRLIASWNGTRPKEIEGTLEFGECD
jgi:hypothetical protein